MINKLQIAGKILDKGPNTFTNSKQTGPQRHKAYNIHLQSSTQEKIKSASSSGNPSSQVMPTTCFSHDTIMVFLNSKQMHRDSISY